MTKADITFIRSLSARAERTAAGLFVAEGVKLVEEMLSSGLTVSKVYYTGEAPAEIAAAGKGAAGSAPAGSDAPASGNAPAVEWERVSSKEMERISFLKTATPALALVEIPHRELSAADPSKALVLALDDVQDPGNLGTIIRIADWFGIDDIVCSQATVDCFNPKVVQATMGAISRVKVHYTDLSAYLREKAAVAKTAAGAPIYGTFMDGLDIYSQTLTPNGIIVMGNEGKGISQNAAETVTHRLCIPSYPANASERSSESLNVAVATAIVCSEFRRFKPTF